MTLLEGFAFRGYRSFESGHPAVLAPLETVNLLAGQNNSGKSNILRALANTYAADTSSTSPWDRPLVDAEHTYRRLEFRYVDDVLDWPGLASLGGNREHVRAFLQSPGIAGDGRGGPGLWIPVADRGVVDEDALRLMAQEIGDSPVANHLSMSLTNSGGGGPGEDAFRVLRWLLAARPTPREAYTVGGVRAISNESDQAPDLNGLSIKRRLLELQNPATDRLGDRALFLAVQEFVRAVLDDPSVTIDIPHDLATIHVTQDGRTLPIENLGTGVHEVVILGAAATVVQNALLLIEEPEVHLHPVLQRKLLRYLASSTTNQYVIATHSAHMLDSKIGSIFHVTRLDGRSSVRFAGDASDRAAICADLGYRPSDLVQTNAVLWVEGPSDRIYLKSWIERLAPDEFIEGTHYSVMFYGGSLLSELSPLDTEEVEEFISLRNLNRYMVVLMDSDRTSPRGALGKSKVRVREGLEDDPSTGVAWVTAGYTIENYIPEDVLTRAIWEAHPSTNATSFQEQSRWQNPLASDRVGIKQPSKVAIAKRATDLAGEEWPLDLRKRVLEVINLIRRANSQT